MISGPAFLSRCAAKTELCVTFVSSLSSGFFRFQSLHGISADDQLIHSADLAVDLNAFGANSNFRISNFEFLREAHFLLRKEVIQPQVPLRLPCYDFIPITSHTFGNCPLAVGTLTSGTTGFHDVTGGVYKARERIHAVVADTALLAIPASWSRVADSNPNWAQFY